MVQTLVRYLQGPVGYVLDVRPNPLEGRTTDVIWTVHFQGETPLRDALRLSRKHRILLKKGSLAESLLDERIYEEHMIRKCISEGYDYHRFLHRYDSIILRGLYVPGMILNIERLVVAIGDDTERIEECLFRNPRPDADIPIDGEMKHLIRVYMRNYAGFHPRR